MFLAMLAKMWAQECTNADKGAECDISKEK